MVTFVLSLVLLLPIVINGLSLSQNPSIKYPNPICLQPSVESPCANPCGHTCATKGSFCPLYCLEPNASNPILICDQGSWLDDNGCCVKVCPADGSCVKPTKPTLCPTTCGRDCTSYHPDGPSLCPAIACTEYTNQNLTVCANENLLVNEITGCCVLPEDCPNQCIEPTKPTLCPSTCGKDCATYFPGRPSLCPTFQCTKYTNRNLTVCANENLLINDVTGCCVRPEDCPSKMCPDCIRPSLPYYCSTACGQTCNTYEGIHECPKCLECSKPILICEDENLVIDDTTGCCVDPCECP